MLHHIGVEGCVTIVLRVPDSGGLRVEASIMLAKHVLHSIHEEREVVLV